MLKSGWNFMFGGGGGGDDEEEEEEKKRTPHEKSIEAANVKIDASEKRVRELERKAAKEHKAAKAYGVMASQAKTPAQRTALKKKGMAALKRAKMYSGHAAKAGGIAVNFESMTLETESVVATVGMVDGMKAMHSTMKELAVEINPDDVSDMMGDIQDTTEEFADIMTTLSNPLQGSTLVDEVDMEDEFDAMMAEEDDRLQEEADVAALNALEVMESVPTTAITTPSAVVGTQSDTQNEFEKMTSKVNE
jgi:hypothetical protein